MALAQRTSSQTSATGSVLSQQPVPLSLGSPTHIAVLVKDNHASRLAVKLAKSLIVNTQKDTLTLVHVVNSELASFSAEQKVLAQFNQDPAYHACTSYKVLVLYEGMLLAEVVSEGVAAMHPHLLVIGSEGLCNDTLNEIEASRRPGQGSKGKRTQPIPQGATAVHLTPLGSTIRRKPSRLATAMRLAQALHQQLPLLLVKNNTVGSFSTGATNGLRCMMDLTSTSRHALDWVLSRLQPGRGDNMVLAVGKALDSNHEGRVRQEAQRLLTTFGVQVSVSSLGGARKRLMREPSHVGLPAAVVDDDIDILITPAPRCRDLAQTTLDLIIKARSSVLLWPPNRLADGTVVKPPHPLRHMLDESVPEDERPLLKPKHQPELLVVDGPWRGRGPRYSFRERDDEGWGGMEGWEPAMMPLRGPMGLRRSMSEMLSGGEAAKERLHRALMRTSTLAAARTGLLHHHALDDDGGGSPGTAQTALCRPPAPWGKGPTAGNAAGELSTANEAQEDKQHEDEERTTWPPCTGPAPWNRNGPKAQIQQAMLAMGAIAEDGELASVTVPGRAARPVAVAQAVGMAAAARPSSSAGGHRSGTGGNKVLVGEPPAPLDGGADHVVSRPLLLRQGSQTAQSSAKDLHHQNSSISNLPAVVVGKPTIAARPMFSAFGRTIPCSYAALPHLGGAGGSGGGGVSVRSSIMRSSSTSQGDGTSFAAVVAAAVAAQYDAVDAS